MIEVVQHPEQYAPERDRSTVFDSTGWALEDHIALDMLVAYADELGLGTWVSVESSADDPRDPYAFSRLPIASMNGRYTQP